MARVKSLRSRQTKDHIEDLRQRAMTGYVYGYISRRRMDRLLALMDAFEREAFIPQREATREINEEAGIDSKALSTKARNAMLKVLRQGNQSKRGGGE